MARWSWKRQFGWDRWPLERFILAVLKKRWLRWPQAAKKDMGNWFFGKGRTVPFWVKVFGLESWSFVSCFFFGRKKNVTIWFWVIGRDMPLKMISQLTFQLEGLVKVKWWQVTSWHSDMYLTPAFLFLSPYKLDEATSQEGTTPTVSTWPSFPLSDWLDKKPPRMTSILVMNCPD